jgi:hypothetical protein
MQRGLKFRTICRDCNSLIGDYDRDLIEFAQVFASIARSGLALPQGAKIQIRPNSIIKSIAGHIVASITEHTLGHPMLDDSMLSIYEAAVKEFYTATREILFDHEAAIPSRWHVYYWPFPHLHTAIQPQMTIFGLRSYSLDPDDMTFCQILKFFSLGFLICDNPDIKSVRALSIFKEQAADFQAVFEIRYHARMQIGQMPTLHLAFRCRRYPFTEAQALARGGDKSKGVDETWRERSVAIRANTVLMNWRRTWAARGSW